MPTLGEEHTWYEDGHWTIDADFCNQGDPIIYEGNTIGYYDIKPEEWWDPAIKKDGWSSEGALTPSRYYDLPTEGSLYIEFFSYLG